MTENCPNRVGNDSWSRLSKNQRRQIIKHRGNVKSLLKEFTAKNPMFHQPPAAE